VTPNKVSNAATAGDCFMDDERMDSRYVINWEDVQIYERTRWRAK
jgi:hypothetical protein